MPTLRAFSWWWVKTINVMYLTHGGWWVSFVNKKLINSQSKKEMEDFIWAKLRIISQETAFQKTPGTVPPERGQGTVVQVFATKYIKVTYWPLHSMVVAEGWGACGNFLKWDNSFKWAELIVFQEWFLCSMQCCAAEHNALCHFTHKRISWDWS